MKSTVHRKPFIHKSMTAVTQPCCCTCPRVARAPSRLVPRASMQETMFNVASAASAVVQTNLDNVGPVTYAICFGAGLVTSVSPCTLSVLPLTVGFIAGYKQERASNGGGTPDGGADVSLSLRGIAFSLGLASTLASLGLVSSSLGLAYGQTGTGDFLPIAASTVAVGMGLNLLGVISLNLPSIDFDVRTLNLSPILTSYMAGATFALVASPCSTPVLATLLAYVTAVGDTRQGGLLLLLYSLGYVTPLLVVAFVTDSLSDIVGLRERATWVTPLSGALLVMGGTYGLLSRL